ncbi:MAG: HD domain-containing protein [Thermoflexibacteraceae bacterium]|jgi:hypothetical protein
MVIKDNKIPDTPIIKEAMSIVQATLSTNIFNHSIRTYLFAYEYARKYHHAFSEEELLLVSLFHDIGLDNNYFVKGSSFQIASSVALREYLMTQKEITPHRINAMMEAINYHFQLKPRWDKGTIAGLLQIGAHMDVLGVKLLSIEKKRRTQILKDYPKKLFFFEFNSCLCKTFTSFDTLLGLFYPQKYCSQGHYIKI